MKPVPKEENVILDEILFSSPGSLNEEMVETKTLKEKIRLFETHHSSNKDDTVPVETRKKKFSISEEDENGFASSEIGEENNEVIASGGSIQISAGGIRTDESNKNSVGSIRTSDEVTFSSKNPGIAFNVSEVAFSKNLEIPGAKNPEVTLSGNRTTTNPEVQKNSVIDKIRTFQNRNNTNDGCSDEISPKLSSIEFPLPSKHSSNNNNNNTVMKSIPLSPINNEKTKIPLSSEIIENTPPFLKQPDSFYAIPNCIKSPNLYINKNLLFSKKDSKSKEVVFRSPGNILTGRPILSTENTIVTEGGILQYYKVSSIDYRTVWYILKDQSRLSSLAACSSVSSLAATAACSSVSSLSTGSSPHAMLQNNSTRSLVNDDLLYSKFILSNVVETVYKRTNFLIFKNEILLVKFIGILLCVFKHNLCIKSIRIENLERLGRTKITVGGETLEFSCEVERERWFEDIENYIKNK